MSDTQEPKAKNVAVETPVKTSSNPRALCSFVTQCCYSNNTLPIDLSFYKKDDEHYALLETKEVDIGKPLSYLRLICDGLIDHIFLDDFPLGQYTLEISGCNCATSRFNRQKGCNEFNFTQKRSDMLDQMISLNRSENESKTTIISRENYVNFKRHDSIRIHYPSSLVLKDTVTLSLHGYFPTVVQSKEYVEDTETRTMYPHDTYYLNINHPTDSLDIFVSSNTGTGMIILEVNGYEVTRSNCYPLSNSSNLGVRIKFQNPYGYLMGAENTYLSDEINRQTLNMSRVNSLALICLNCRPVKIIQSLYNIYHYPSRTKVFC
jgi:hypothetical protein